MVFVAGILMQEPAKRLSPLKLLPQRFMAEKNGKKKWLGYEEWEATLKWIDDNLPSL